jgi:hypothetical protein
MAKPEFLSGDVTGKMKQFATYFTRGVRNGSQLRKTIYACGTADEVCGAVDRFFAEQLVDAA